MLDFAAMHQPGFAPDRESLAEFLHAYRAEIKEAFRARFASAGLGYYDSSDFFATILRRADQLTSRVDRAASHDLGRMLREVMLEALSDCARSALSERRLRHELRTRKRGWFGARAPIIRRDADGDSEELSRLHLSRDELDLVRLRAGGLRHSTVAAALGVSAATVRMRWLRLVHKARASLEHSS